MRKNERQGLLQAWDKFHDSLPDGEYAGLGEMRMEDRRPSRNTCSRFPGERQVAIGEYKRCPLLPDGGCHEQT